MSTKKKKEVLLGGYEKTGVFITKADMDQLIEVIAKAKIKDNLIKRLPGVGQFGVQTGMGTATMGSIGIQDFIRKLVMVYGFEDSDKKLYGVNKHGEILRWLSPAEMAKTTH